METGEDRFAETSLDPRPLGVHRHVDDAAENAGDDEPARDRDAGPGLEPAERRAENDRADRHHPAHGDRWASAPPADIATR